MGVVVNRVDTALRVHRKLDKQVDALLLTGRMRPLDRDRKLEEYQDRLRTGRTRNAEAAPLVLVATQAVEAGADIDLDALVTECAALDALVQRFGRVDRAGDIAKWGEPATSVILATSVDVTDTALDPLYGDRLRRTWQWLQNRQLDFGVDTFTVGVATRAELSSQAPEAPFLMPSYLDRWVQTSVTPDADPDPAHWLHGVQAGSPEVSVVWRADVLPKAFAEPGSADESDIAHQVAAVVGLCPPGSAEAIALPVWAAQAWLAGLADGPSGEASSFSDTTRDDVGSADATTGPRAAVAPALNWNGDDSTVVRTVRDLRPGSTLVVPAAYGGIRADNWDPTAREPVTDLGGAVHLTQRGRAVLRLHPALEVGELALLQPAPESDRDDDPDLVLGWLDEWAANGITDPYSHAVVSALRKVNKKSVDVFRVPIGPPGADGQPPPEMFVIRARHRIEVTEKQKRRREVSVADSEPSTSSFLGTEVPLELHLTDVERWAQQIATACGLPPPIAADLALAGRLHDLGKVDPRFQLMLRDGVVSTSAEPLAKSVLPAADYQKRRRARATAGYPLGTRHELATVALVHQDPALRDQANDWDLVLHLIASHHGYARPFVPVSIDRHPQQLRAQLNGRVLEACSDHGLLRLDSGVPQLFWRCVRRYGWYGLAWLEAVLRLADHRASEERAG